MSLPERRRRYSAREVRVRGSGPCGPAELKALSARLRDVLADVEMFGPEDQGPMRDHSIGDLRRRRSMADTLATITLVEEDGVLRWERRSPVSSLASGRRSRSLGSRAGVVVEQLRFEALGASDVGSFLRARDHRLNPRRGLLELAPRDGGLVLSDFLPRQMPARRALLVVHDLFGSGQRVLDEIGATRPGREMLDAWLGRYERVLTFEHATMSLSPLANAVDLMRATEDIGAPIDVVAHGRGGVVVRLWLDELRRSSMPCGRAVFVGSPLAGTSLARPTMLKRTLDLLTNVWNVLEKKGALLGTAAPLLDAILTIAKVLGSAMKAVTSASNSDGMAVGIPGIASISPEDTNFEIDQRRAPAPSRDDYFAVRSNFEPQPAGWKFWRAFTERPWERLAESGVDVLFRGPNDLMVDTCSMADLGSGSSIPPDRVLTLGRRWDERRGEHRGAANVSVHHFNYFRDPDVVRFIDRALGGS